MMILLQLFYEYFKVGLFAVGGGLATIPFLAEMAEKTKWFSVAELANMVAVAESTPGPIGVNVATYVGFRLCGIPGAIVATVGLVLPSFIIIYIISGFLEKFKENKYVQAGLCGIRPASTGLITVALVSLVLMSFEIGTAKTPAMIGIAIVIFVLTNFVPKVKKWHPVVFILLAAVAGVIFKL